MRRKPWLSGWDLFVGIAFMEAVIDQSAATAEIGQNPGLSPSHQANLVTTCYHNLLRM
jgi:catecholate siderophore receptor